MLDDMRDLVKRYGGHENAKEELEDVEKVTQPEHVEVVSVTV